MFRKRLALTTVLSLCFATPLAAQSCGGGFGNFVGGLKNEAQRKGYDAQTVNAFFANVRQDQAVIKADRSQGHFQKDFITFSRNLISSGRINNAVAKSRQYNSLFSQIERSYGVPRGVLLAFWAFETDFGQVQGNFNTLNALVTLAHDCRRPHLFRPQVFAALDLYRRGEFDPARTTGAWAGEIGQVQMLPGDILENGRDGDGDGRVDLKGSAPDALVSGAQMLRHLGWRPGEPWMQEIVVPSNLDWFETGLGKTKSVSQWARLGVQPRSGDLGSGNLQASVLLPMGRNGPAFLTYRNFDVYFEWNKSMVYVTTAAYFATRIMGAPIYDAGNPSPALSGRQIQQLQRKLQARGHDVGGVDGILGAKTRQAVQLEQRRLGLPADAWPTAQLLNAL